MEVEQKIELLVSQLNKLETNDIKKLIIKTNDDLRDEADLPLEIMLEHLRRRLAPSEFINFCNNL